MHVYSKHELEQHQAIGWAEVLDKKPEEKQEKPARTKQNRPN